MHATVRIAAFAAGVALLGGGAAAVGRATDARPLLDGGRPGAGSGSTMAMSGHEDASMGDMKPMAVGADGTRLSLDGITLAPAYDRLPAGGTVTWGFRILDRAGVPIRRFELDQTKLVHLIVSRTDLTGYQHLHPSLATDGTFSVALALDHPGRYRAIADFTTGGRRYVLGTTLTAPGVATNMPLPATATAASVDGYQVALHRPAGLVAGRESEMTFSVTRAGRPAADLQPYLGAYGHLVALHQGDLAYSHVHPTGDDLARGAITFHTELPVAGAYRLFLQFRTGGRVHTAAFTQNATTS